MYILIKSGYESLKSSIQNLIETGQIKTWEFIVEEERRRLRYIGDENQYADVVLRFITSYYDGMECLKIVPTIRKATPRNNQKIAEKTVGIVLGRFSELLNTHFIEIGSYETML